LRFLDPSAGSSTRGLYQLEHDLANSPRGFDRYAVNLLEHATDANKVVVEYLFGCIEQLEDRFVTH